MRCHNTQPIASTVPMPRTSNLSATRDNTGSGAYNNPSASLWAVPGDASHAPIQLASMNSSIANLTNSWGRWAPFAQTVGATSEPLYWVTVSSKRDFGVRLVGANQPQVWMAPFFPNRAAAASDPSDVAFRLPFQTLQNGNHIAQWTDAVVIARKADGSPLTQAEAVANAKANARAN